jgi:hypothetical protein
MLRVVAMRACRGARTGVATWLQAGVLLVTTCARPAEVPEIEHPGARRLAEVTCDLLVECDCGGPYPDFDSCTTRYTTLLVQEHQAAAEGSLLYDENCEHNFIVRLEAQGCSSFVEPPRCDEGCRLFHGLGELGEACRWYGNHHDCGQGLECVWDPLEGDVCVPACPDEPDEPEVGDPCPDWRCPDGAFCHDDEGVCAPIPGIGEPCDIACTDDAYCPADPSSDRVCERRRELGEPCEHPFSCENGLWCDVFADEPTCFEPPKVGEPCWHESCGEGAFCDQTPDAPSCVPLHEPGEPCTSSDACLSGRCCEGHCLAPTPAVCRLIPWSGPSDQSMAPPGLCRDPT